MARSRRPPAALRKVAQAPSTVPEQLSLVPVGPAGPAELAAPATPAPHLWLCVSLPELPLEAVLDSEEPAAVFEEQKGIRRVLLTNAKAQAAGVRPGLSINAALALAPTLQLEARNPDLEAEVLKNLAEWAEQFTAFVSIEAPSLLLLELAGSLRLFGGLKALRERIVDAFVEQGFYVDVAIAPTPLAATWLAQARQKVCIRDVRNLLGKLKPLPIIYLGWPESVCSALKGMGITSVGDALRLPRQAFAKRFGATRLLEFDRATGRMPDPRISHRAPERFVADYDLSEEESDSSLLLNICQALLGKLEQFLLSRQMAVQHIEFVFYHLQEAATHLPLGCVQADRAVKHWLALLEIKFDRLALPAPVIAVQLSGGQGQAFMAETDVLRFNQQTQRRHIGSIAHLAERLSARMGETAVHGVATVAEHRPQHAWRPLSAFDDVPHCVSASDYVGPHNESALLAAVHSLDGLMLRRPLWILQTPEPLVLEQGRPCYQGALQLLEGPERLETGWWDDDGIARDYFVAGNAWGVRLWIFKNRGNGPGKPRGAWYLHGMFG